MGKKIKWGRREKGGKAWFSSLGKGEEKGLIFFPRGRGKGKGNREGKRERREKKRERREKGRVKGGKAWLSSLGKGEEKGLIIGEGGKGKGKGKVKGKREGTKGKGKKEYLDETIIASCWINNNYIHFSFENFNIKWNFFYKTKFFIYFLHNR